MEGRHRDADEKNCQPRLPNKEVMKTMVATQESLLYDRFHQRCPTKALVEFILRSDRLEIRVEKFIQQLELVESKNRFYAKNVVKILIDNVELLDEEGTGRGIRVVPTTGGVYLSEWLYEKYVQLLNVPQPPPTAKDVIQYRIAEDIKVKIEETPYVISASGTTGFRTWEAALYLSMYLADQGATFISQGCKVLELGAGTGIVSATLSLKYQDTIDKLYVTDGDAELIKQLNQNFQLNGIKRPRLIFEKLWWNQDKVPNDIDCIVAADVTYDTTVIPDLCQCIAQCLGEQTNCIISATIRNEQTTKHFEQELQGLGLHCEVISTTETDLDAMRQLEESLLFRPLMVPIRIYHIVRSENANRVKKN